MCFNPKGKRFGLAFSFYFGGAYLCTMRFALLCVVVLFAPQVWAQNNIQKQKVTPRKNVMISFRPQQNFPLTVGWVSPVGWHMGLYAQTDYLLRIKWVEKKKKPLLRKPFVKQFSKETALQPGFITYSQPDNHTGTALYTNLAWSRMRGKRLSYQFGPSLAYMRTWYHGKVYSFDNNKLPGRGYVTPGINFNLQAKHGHHRKPNVQPKGYFNFTFSMWLPAKWGAGTGMLMFWGTGWKMNLNQWKGVKN